MRSMTIYNRSMRRYTDRPPEPKFGYMQFFTNNKETFIDVPQAQIKINKADLRRIILWCLKRLTELGGPI